mgnify:CR=1 FL=1
MISFEPIELVGYASSLFIAISFMMTDIFKLRIINLYNLYKSAEILLTKSIFSADNSIRIKISRNVPSMEIFMSYIVRHMENRILELSKSYSAILLTGPRQSGKTTMLRALSKEENKGREYMSLDDLTTRDMTKNDPALFLQIHKPPVFIDEVQYAPELFTYIRLRQRNYLYISFQCTTENNNCFNTAADRISVSAVQPKYG